MTLENKTIATNDITFKGEILNIREDIYMLNIPLKCNLSLLTKLDLNGIDYEKLLKENKIEIYFNYFYKENIGELEVLIYDNNLNKITEEQEELQILPTFTDKFIKLERFELEAILKKLNDLLMEKSNVTLIQFLQDK